MVICIKAFPLSLCTPNILTISNRLPGDALRKTPLPLGSRKLKIVANVVNINLNFRFWLLCLIKIVIVIVSVSCLLLHTLYRQSKLHIATVLCIVPPLIYDYRDLQICPTLNSNWTIPIVTLWTTPYLSPIPR